MFIPFGEYTPDLPIRDSSGASVVKNCVPAGDSYKQFKDLVAYSDALENYPRGYINTQDAELAPKVFAGEQAKLKILSGSSWSDVSKVGGYSLNSEEKWEFAKFGTQIIATCIDEPMQEYTMNTSSVFANLSADAPQARHIAVVRDFVVAGNTYDATDDYVPNRVRWPDIGTTTSWAITGSTQADYQDLNGNNGAVRKVVGGEYGTIFQERAINRMTYVGGDVVWQFDEVETGRGALVSGGVIKVGRFIFFPDETGFYVFDGNQSIPIGENKIDKTFFSDLAIEHIHRMSCEADPVNKLVLWSYTGANNSNGRPNRILVYNYSPQARKRWTLIEKEHEFLGKFTSGGVNVDSGVVTDIDSATYGSISLDSRFWTGYAPDLSAFTTDNKLGTFNGDPLTAVIETGETGGTERKLLQELRPDVDEAGTITMQIGTRESQSDAVTWGDDLVENDVGNYPCLSNSRYHRVRVTIEDGFKDARGIDVNKMKKSGLR